MFTCFIQVPTSRHPHFYLFHSSVVVATSAFLLVSFKCRRRDICNFTCFIQVSTSRHPHFYLFHSSVDVATSRALYIQTTEQVVINSCCLPKEFCGADPLPSSSLFTSAYCSSRWNTVNAVVVPKIAAFSYAGRSTPTGEGAQSLYLSLFLSLFPFTLVLPLTVKLMGRQSITRRCCRCRGVAVAIGSGVLLLLSLSRRRCCCNEWGTVVTIAVVASLLLLLLSRRRCCCRGVALAVHIRLYFACLSLCETPNANSLHLPVL